MATLTTPRLLRAARELMNDGGRHWIKGGLARTAARYSTAPDAREAVEFCSIGGVENVLATTGVVRRSASVSNHGYFRGNAVRDRAICRLATAICRRDDSRSFGDYATPGRRFDARSAYEVSVAERIVARFNDHMATTWEDVSSVFEVAEGLR